MSKIGAGGGTSQKRSQKHKTAQTRDSAAPGYLDLMDGGHMAKSITLSSSATAQGLVVTGFYTATTNSILVINPTASSFGGVTLQISNSGLTSPQATLFTLNSANMKIGSWPISLVAATNGPQATFDIPPYSVLGMSLDRKSTRLNSS